MAIRKTATHKHKPINYNMRILWNDKKTGKNIIPILISKLQSEFY